MSMGTIFEDPKVQESAIEAIQEEFDERGLGDASLVVRCVLDEAVAALDREALIESAARAIQRAAAQGLSPGYMADGVSSALARDALVAIGLIPADSTDGE